MTLDSFFVHLGDKFVEKEQYNKIWIVNILLPQIMSAIICVVPATLAAYFGAAYVEDFITMLSGTPLKIFQIIGGLMPALGIAITLQYIFKGESRVFILGICSCGVFRACILATWNLSIALFYCLRTVAF